TLADTQGGLVDRFALQTLGGIKLEHPVGAQDVYGTDLGHHVGGDLGDDLVEPGLCADRLRHDLPEAAEQDARPGGGPPHVRLSSKERPEASLRGGPWPVLARPGCAPTSCRVRIANAKSVPQA